MTEDSDDDARVNADTDSDEREARAVGDSISTTFQMAKRTITVRESDSLYDCYMKSVEGFKDYHNFGVRFTSNYDKHVEYVRVESYRGYRHCRSVYSPTRFSL